MMIGADPRLYALLFTLVGAVGLSLIQTDNKRVPQEAIIGIIYAVASAASILLMAKTPHGDADVTEILFGNILAISPVQITEMAVLFGGVALLHVLFHRQFFALLQHHAEPTHFGGKLPKGKPVSPLNFWNMLFYLSLALVISEAIGVAGVLQVFSYLIVPAVCALLMFRGLLPILLTALGIAALASVGGLYASYTYDLPPGASIVAAFGVLFLISAGIARVIPKKANQHSALGKLSEATDSVQLPEKTLIHH
jgi:zinc/manganese transport system permease protein